MLEHKLAGVVVAFCLVVATFIVFPQLGLERVAGILTYTTPDLLASCENVATVHETFWADKDCIVTKYGFLSIRQQYKTKVGIRLLFDDLPYFITVIPNCTEKVVYIHHGWNFLQTFSALEVHDATDFCSSAFYKAMIKLQNGTATASLAAKQVINDSLTYVSDKIHSAVDTTKNTIQNFVNNTKSNVHDLVNATKSNVHEIANSTKVRVTAGMDSIRARILKSINYFGYCTFTVYLNDRPMGLQNGFHYTRDSVVNIGNGLALQRYGCENVTFKTTSKFAADSDKLESTGLNYDFNRFLGAASSWFPFWKVSTESHAWYKPRYPHVTYIPVHGFKDVSCNESKLAELFCDAISNNLTCNYTRVYPEFGLSNIIRNREMEVDYEFEKRNITRNYDEVYNKVTTEYGTYIFNCTDGTVSKIYVYYTPYYSADVKVPLVYDNGEQLNQYDSDKFQVFRDNNWYDMSYIEIVVFRLSLNAILILIILYCIIGTSIFSAMGKRFYPSYIMGPFLAIRMIQNHFPFAYWYCVAGYMIGKSFLSYFYQTERGSIRAICVMFSIMITLISCIKFDKYEIIDYRGLFVQIMLELVMHVIFRKFLKRFEKGVNFNYLASHYISESEYKHALKRRVEFYEDAEDSCTVEEVLSRFKNYSEFSANYACDLEKKTSQGLITTHVARAFFSQQQYLSLIARKYYGDVKTPFYLQTLEIDVSKIEVDELAFVLYPRDQFNEFLRVLKQLESDDKIKLNANAIRRRKAKMEARLESQTTLQTNMRTNHGAGYYDRVFECSTDCFNGNSRCQGFLWNTDVLRVPRHIFVGNEFLTDTDWLKLYNDVTNLLNQGRRILSGENFKGNTFVIRGIRPFVPHSMIWEFDITTDVPITCDAPPVSNSAGHCFLIYKNGNRIEDFYGIANGSGIHNCSTQKGFCGGPVMNNEGILGYHILTSGTVDQNLYFNDSLINDRLDQINHYCAPSGAPFGQDYLDETGERRDVKRLDCDFQVLVATILIHRNVKEKGAIKPEIPTPQFWNKIQQDLSRNIQVCVDHIDKVVARILLAAQNQGYMVINEAIVKTVIVDVYRKIHLTSEFLDGKIIEKLTSNVQNLPSIMLAFKNFCDLDYVFRTAVEKLRTLNIHSLEAAEEMGQGNKIKMTAISRFLNGLKASPAIVQSLTFTNLFDKLGKFVNGTLKSDALDKFFDDVVKYADELWPNFIDKKLNNLTEDDKKYILQYEQKQSLAKHICTTGEFSRILRDKLEPFNAFSGEEGYSNLRDALEASIKDYVGDVSMEFDEINALNYGTTILKLLILCKSFPGGLLDHIYTNYVRRVSKNLLEAANVKVKGEDAATKLKSIIAMHYELKSNRKEFDDYIKSIQDLQELDNLIDALENHESSEFSGLRKSLKTQRNQVQHNNMQMLAQHRRAEKNVQLSDVTYNAMVNAQNQEIAKNLNKALESIVRNLLDLHKLKYRFDGDASVIEDLINLTDTATVWNLLDGVQGMTYSITMDQKNYLITGYLLATRVYKVKDLKGNTKWIFDEYYFKEDPINYLHDNKKFYIFSEPVLVYRMASEPGVIEQININVHPDLIANDLTIEHDNRKMAIIKIDRCRDRNECLALLQTPYFANMNHDITIVPIEEGRLEADALTLNGYGYCRDGVMELPCGHILKCHYDHVHNAYGCYYSLVGQLSKHFQSVDSFACTGVPLTSSFTKSWMSINHEGVIHRCNQNKGKIIPCVTHKGRTLCTADCYINAYNNTNCCFRCNTLSGVEGRNNLRRCHCERFHGFVCPKAESCKDPTCKLDHPTDVLETNFQVDGATLVDALEQFNKTHLFDNGDFSKPSDQTIDDVLNRYYNVKDVVKVFLDSDPNFPVEQLMETLRKHARRQIEKGNFILEAFDNQRGLKHSVTLTRVGNQIRQFNKPVIEYGDAHRGHPGWEQYVADSRFMYDSKAISGATVGNHINMHFPEIINQKPLGTLEKLKIAKRNLETTVQATASTIMENNKKTHVMCTVCHQRAGSPLDHALETGHVAFLYEGEVYNNLDAIVLHNIVKPGETETINKFLGKFKDAHTDIFTFTRNVIGNDARPFLGQSGGH